MTLTPAAWKTAPDAAVKLASRSCRTKLHAHPCIFQVHQEVPGLLHYPGLDRVLRGAKDPDPASVVLNHGQDAGLRAVEQVGGEGVQRQHRPGLGPQEFGPARAVPAWRRADASVLEDLPDR